ncbi:MAG TPA: 23S rRNA (guanosine(2251)-2'-O)-methyltransferase RlmB [Chloroflexota bacterium]|nr:23S rRNA (guanosine(2251)-2'-O)-methyltransferase RlmB [Chloroflexota bacterium]
MSWDWIYGRNAIREALMSGAPVNRVLVSRSAHGVPIDQIVQLAREHNVDVELVDRTVLDQRTGNHQGVIAEIQPARMLSLGDLVEMLDTPSGTDRVLMLDSVQDPGNLGALIRTAVATGVRAVVIPEHRAAGVTPAVVKASAGAALRVPIVQTPNLRQAAVTLKQIGFWVVGLDGEARERYDRANLTGPLVIVVGAEGRGLGDLLARECDILVRLPIEESVESLNASVAGSILLYHLYREALRNDPRRIV